MSVKFIAKALELPADKRLISTDYLVLIVLADSASATGECWPSMRRLASSAKVSQRTARRSVARLVEFGLLESMPRYREFGGQSSNGYTLFPDVEAILRIAADAVRGLGLPEGATGDGGGQNDRGGDGQAPLGALDKADRVYKNRQLEPSGGKEERTTLSRAEMAERFKQLWESSPKRIGANRLAAWQSFRARLFEVSDVVAEADMMAIGVQAWADHVKATGDDLQFAPGLAAFINLKRYRDDWTGATDWRGREVKGHG